jgi:hypothetical protein
MTVDILSKAADKADLPAPSAEDIEEPDDYVGTIKKQFKTLMGLEMDMAEEMLADFEETLAELEAASDHPQAQHHIERHKKAIAYMKKELGQPSMAAESLLRESTINRWQLIAGIKKTRK